MDSRNYRKIYENMDEGIAFFRIVMNERNEMEAAVIEACNSHYLDVSESYGLSRDRILHRSYFDIAPDHDPRWDYYMYQAAILKNHVHGGFRNRDFGSWMEFSGGPAVEENTCWMMFIDHTKFQDENEKLLQERNIDQLTGVKNRNAYEDAVKKCHDNHEPIGVIVVDINGLKEANDTKGHPEGDRLIADTASFLCTITHETLPYRIGGDEFVLLLENCTERKLEEDLEKIRMHAEVSVSCGAAWREHSDQIEEALKEADAEMYEDKRAYYRNHERRHVR